MSRSIVVIPDIHVPDHSPPMVNAVIQFIGEYQPDEVVIIGDLMDYPQPSRWSKGTEEEFEGSVFRDSDQAVKEVLKPLRAAFPGDLGFIEGNHDSRPRDYLKKYAPALRECDAFDIDILLNFDEHGIKMLPDFYDFHPGWTMCHGHKGGIKLSQTAGMTALGAAKRFGKSVVIGHVHRLGVIDHTIGYDGELVWELTGMEVGHLVDTSRMGYLRSSTPNWQAGFGILQIDGDHVNATAVPIKHNKFIVEGVTFECT